MNDWLLPLWQGLGWPLLRLLFFISLGLLAANFLESLNWTRQVAFLARPFLRFGHLSATTGASFSMGFLSGVTANTLLAEGYEKGRLSRRELILANLFNSLPTYFLHLPTTFFITASLIKEAALLYIGLTLGAAVLRTFGIILLARVLLPEPRDTPATLPPGGLTGRDGAHNSIWQRTWKRFTKRFRRILSFTIPIYVLFFFLQRTGLFAYLERFMAENIHFLSWLSPEAVSIVALQIIAEFTAGLAAAGALLQAGTLDSREVVLALLVGNILSSPIRAFRHQFPYYAGIFRPRLALELIFFSQTFRALSILLMMIVYWTVS